MLAVVQHTIGPEEPLEDTMKPDDWPLLKPEVQEWHLIVYTRNGKYRATVTARTREDACREVVHVQMSEGRVVQRIELIEHQT